MSSDWYRDCSQKVSWRQYNRICNTSKSKLKSRWRRTIRKQTASETSSSHHEIQSVIPRPQTSWRGPPLCEESSVRFFVRGKRTQRTVSWLLCHASLLLHCKCLLVKFECHHSLEGSRKSRFVTSEDLKSVWNRYSSCTEYVSHSYQRDMNCDYPFYTRHNLVTNTQRNANYCSCDDKKKSHTLSLFFFFSISCHPPRFCDIKCWRVSAYLYVTLASKIPVYITVKRVTVEILVLT